MQREHESVVAAQFGPRAKAYVESAVHAQGPDLEALEGILSALKPRHAAKVTASDLSPEMMAAVAAAARGKGLSNIETAVAPAELLPFADGNFDFLGCRYSAHHWRDFDGGLREARRVLRPGASAAFIDVYAPGRALFDTHLQAVELLRDRSHVRNYTAGEWLAALARAGFALSACRTWRLRMDFAVWTARMATPEENIRAIRALQRAASGETKRHFALEEDGSFLLDVLMVETVAA